MVETSKRLKSWRKQVELRAKLIVDDIIKEPVEVDVVFYFKRPLKHYLPNGMVRQAASCVYHQQKQR